MAEGSAGRRQGKSWLAARLGVSPARVTELVKEGRIPDRPVYTEADAKRIGGELLDARATNNASSAQLEESAEQSALEALSRNPERVARIKQIVERTAALKLNREIKAGAYVRKAEVEQERTARVFSVRAKLQELPLRAALIANKSEAECEAIIKDWVREVCNHYANGGS